QQPRTGGRGGRRQCDEDARADHRAESDGDRVEGAETTLQRRAVRRAHAKMLCQLTGSSPKTDSRPHTVAATTTTMTSTIEPTTASGIDHNRRNSSAVPHWST